jgi:post-segregation antitoxin (ccd killing protein)
MAMKKVIYVPEKLARRLDAVEGLNVSALCQRAIEAELDRRDALRDATADIDQVVARLRASRSDDYEAERAKGRELGLSWARETATLTELEELSEIGRDRWLWFELYPEHSLVRQLVVQEGWWPEDLATDARFDRRDDNGPFIEGILAGALEVYDAAAPHLRD